VNCDREHVYIDGRAVLHATACRDWVCGECGSRLTTRWFDEAPNWRTVCASEPDHDADNFVHRSTWAYMEHRRLTGDAQAADVFANLPPELQAAILATS